MTAPRARHLLGLVVIAAAAALAPAAEVVILKDGFVIQGTVRKEMTTVVDKASGLSVSIVKANGLDIVDEGPKVVVFSSHAKQLGAISPDVKLRPEYKAFTMPFPGRQNNTELPSLGNTIKITEFDAKWTRVMEIKVPGAKAESVKQIITYMDPYAIAMHSPTHLWRVTFRTSEWDPRLVRRLLLTHPEIAEPDGKCAPLKRILLAKFMIDAGWLQFAKDEVERLKKDADGPLPKDAQE
ncbi:MAG: hypothetical protein K2V38_16185, partial [Gemmataceae bacterium]|nr:hypothetical protein [Gemmataceae bacterium]